MLDVDYVFRTTQEQRVHLLPEHERREFVILSLIIAREVNDPHDWIEKRRRDLLKKQQLFYVIPAAR